MYQALDLAAGVPVGDLNNDGYSDVALVTSAEDGASLQGSARFAYGKADPSGYFGVGAVDESGHAVLPLHEVMRDVADRGKTFAFVAADGQQELVLRRCDACFGGSLGTPFQEPADARPELEQSRELVVV